MSNTGVRFNHINCVRRHAICDFETAYLKAYDDRKWFCMVLTKL
jgi:hypothetical protein